MRNTRTECQWSASALQGEDCPDNLIEPSGCRRMRLPDAISLANLYSAQRRTLPGIFERQGGPHIKQIPELDGACQFTQDGPQFAELWGLVQDAVNVRRERRLPPRVAGPQPCGSSLTGAAGTRRFHRAGNRCPSSRAAFPNP